MIDDQTVAYVVVAQTCFEDLKQVAAQLAGLLVLSSKPDHPMLLSAEQAYRSAVDGLKSARVSARAKAHHEHLLAAASNLGSRFGKYVYRETRCLCLNGHMGICGPRRERFRDSR